MKKIFFQNRPNWSGKPRSRRILSFFMPIDSRKPHLHPNSSFAVLEESPGFSNQNFVFFKFFLQFNTLTYIMVKFYSLKHFRKYMRILIRQWGQCVYYIIMFGKVEQSTFSSGSGWSITFLYCVVRPHIQRISWT